MKVFGCIMSVVGIALTTCIMAMVMDGTISAMIGISLQGFVTVGVCLCLFGCIE